jgi:hypothetical protein
MVDYFDLTNRIKIPDYDENVRTQLSLGIAAASMHRALGRSFIEILKRPGIRDGIRLYKTVMPDNLSITQKDVEGKILDNPWVSDNFVIYQELLREGYSTVQAGRLIWTLGVVKCGILPFLKDGLNDKEKSYYNKFIEKLFSE